MIVGPFDKAPSGETIRPADNMQWGSWLSECSTFKILSGVRREEKKQEEKEGIGLPVRIPFVVT